MKIMNYIGREHKDLMSFHTKEELLNYISLKTGVPCALLQPLSLLITKLNASIVIKQFNTKTLHGRRLCLYCNKAELEKMPNFDETKDILDIKLKITKEGLDFVV